MKRNVFSLLIFTVFILIGCSSEKKKSNYVGKPLKFNPVETVNQETKELEKAEKLGVRERRTYAYFYDKVNEKNKDRYLAEKIVFNDAGLKSEYYQYASGKIEVDHNVYEYDDNLNLVSTVSYESGRGIKFRRESEFDENGYEIERIEFTKPTIGDVKNIAEYNSKGNLISVKSYLPSGEMISKFVFVYDSLGRMISKSNFGKKNNLNDAVFYTYNKAGLVIKELHKRAFLKDLVIHYDYDSLGRMTVYNPGYIKRTYDYDDEGNVTIETLYDKDGYLQSKFEYLYDAKGLVYEKIHYDGNNKPAILLRYEYDFR